MGNKIYRPKEERIGPDIVPVDNGGVEYRQRSRKQGKNKWARRIYYTLSVTGLLLLIYYILRGSVFR